MIPLDALCLVGGAIAIASYVFGYFTGKCSKENPCSKCSFHVNEQRVSKMEAERLRVEEAERQAVLRHNMEHKGAGYLDADPDKFNCADEHCSRNTQRVP